MEAKRERYTPHDVGPSPLEWETPYLTEVSTLITNGFVGTATPHYTDDSGIPYLYGTNVRANKIDSKGIRYISHEFHGKQAKTALKVGDLLTVQSGHIGETAAVTEEFDNANCHALIVTRLKKELVYPQFLSYYINSEIGRARLKGLEVGSTILHINTKDLKRFRVLLPSLSEQQKIAKILSTWDKAISTTERLIENSTQQKKALMQQLLTGKKRLLDESGRRFEGEWKMSSLGNLAIKVGSGKTPKGGSESYQNTGIPLIRSQNVLWGKLDLSDVAYIDEEQNKKMKGSSVFRSDVLLNITGASIGRVAISNLDEANVNQHVCIIRTDDYLDNEFLKYTLLSFEGQKQIERFQAGGNRQGLNFEQIKSFKLITPSTEEQQKIATVLTTADEEIEFLEQQLADLQQEKKALMQVLLTGKRRVVVDGAVA